jgi:hypothetical protein
MVLAMLFERLHSLALGAFRQCDRLSVGPRIIVFPQGAILKCFRFENFSNCILQRPRQSDPFLTQRIFHIEKLSQSSVRHSVRWEVRLVPVF